MKQFLPILGLLFTINYSVSAQEALSGHLNTGVVIPFNDFTGASFKGVKPNILVAPGLGYSLGDSGFRLRGDFTLATMNGDNDRDFYETSFYEGLLTAQYDVVNLFGDSDFKLYLTAGAGLLFYYSKLYDIQTRSRISESPIPSESSFSANPVLAGGFEMGYPLSQNLEINLGFVERALIGNDYMDAFASGSSDDLYGNLTVGLTFYLKDKKDVNMVEMDRSKYNRLISTIDSLENTSNQGDPEEIARLEMESKDKDVKIQILENELDSLRAKVVKIDTEKRNIPPAPDSEALLSSPRYRIIVASLPSRTMAQRWIDRSNLDKSEMIIVYVSDLNTYRVIYKSYDSYEAARKEQQQVKSVVSDAWIKKF